MYVAVKGGEAAIANAHRLLAEDRRGDPQYVIKVYADTRLGSKSAALGGPI